MKLAWLLTAFVLAYPLAAHADFAFTQYATVSPASGWSFVAGQFAGDGRMDLAAYHPSDGSVWVGENTGSGGPDLIVRVLEATGPATVNAENRVEVPIRVIVRNQGTMAAGVFKAAIEYTRPEGTFVVAFTVPGQDNIWYPRTSTPLAPEAEVTFTGKVTFHPAVHGVTVLLTAIADSCSGEEFTPDYCHVKESSEDNNELSSITLALP